jgi:hypothetical protein
VVTGEVRKIAIIVELAEGASLPDYLTLRADIAASIKTVDIDPVDLEKLKDDPRILTHEANRRLRLTPGS